MKTETRVQKGKKSSAPEKRKGVQSQPTRPTNTKQTNATSSNPINTVPSKPTNTTPSKPTSKQRYRVAKARNDPWIRLGIILVPVMLIALVVVLIVRAQVSSADPSTTGSIPGVVTYGNLSRQHVTGTINYPQVPPVGGNHNPVWQNCGIYTQPIANENAVHSMEHGAVWITYQPTLSSQDISQLTTLASGHTYVLLSPYPNLPSPVVISAWGVQLKVTSASDPRLAQFLKYYEQGPQTQEPGAACSGGTGTPDGQ